MSYLNQIECKCLVSSSDSIESPIELSATLSADPACLSAVVEGSAEVIADTTWERSHGCTLEAFSDIEDHISADIGFFLEIINAVGDIDDGLTVDYSITQEVKVATEISSDFLDKFHGDFPSYFDLINYDNTQKLFPSGDFGSSDFISSNDTTVSLYSFIEEGIFTGSYTKQSAYSQLLTDDLTTYITPNTNHTEGIFTYKAYLDSFTVKPSDTRLLIRLSAPLNNLESRIPPRYTVKDIKFEDPNGDLIVQYENFTFLGDATDDQGNNKFKNFTTYSLKPKKNVVAESYAWKNNYPDLHSKNGYTITLTVLAQALDDAFDQGFTEGFADIVESGNLYPDLLPTNSIRISAIEIWNSGFPGVGPSPENYLPIIIMPPEKGKRLERKIRPTLIPKFGFDTTIFPSSGNLLWRDHSSTYSNIDECNNNKLITYITDGNNNTFITTDDVVNDSGKLILKFSTGGSQVSEVTPGAFNFAFDQSTKSIWTSPTFSDGRYHPSGAYNTENTNPLDQVDNIFHSIDSISLSVTAKKSANTRNFFLDIVGYSDDCILNVTSPTGGFLQQPSGEDFITPFVASGSANIDDLGIGGEAISDRFSYFESSVSGDHYQLSRHPLIDSEEFRTYEIPLKIFKEEAELGGSRDYSWSTFLENLYLDIFPLPSGACISDIHLIVRYNPQNAFTLSTQGGDIGRLQSGRSEGAFYPRSRAASDAYLNAGSGYNPLSRLEGVPHQFTSPDTLKTNYARRWRGIKGLAYGDYDIKEFGFGFNNPQLDSPLIDCYLDFSKRSGARFTSRDLKLVDPIQVDFNKHNVGVSAPEVYQNIGLRFTSGTLFEDILPGYSGLYKTSDWTSLSKGSENFENHELYGQIFDGYDNVVRFGSGDSLQFSNVNPSSGIVLYTRFIPDANVSGSNYNFLERSNIFTIKDSPSSQPTLEVGFSGGYLFASGVSLDKSEFIQDSISYSGYQYPLSVLVTYDEKFDNKLRIYTDNELYKGQFTNLRATSGPVQLLQHTNMYFGFDEHSRSGLPMLACEVGFTTPFGGSGSHIVESLPDKNLKQISAVEFFDNQRSKFFDPGESHTNDTYKLWDYVNEDTYNDWFLGDFENPVFSAAFSTLSKRSGRDLVSFYLENDGVPYVNRTDLQFPSNVDSGVSYHTQIENDFLRFHLTDTVDNFYSVYPRVRKDLPSNYKFTDGALIVDTIINHQSSGNINWSRCDVGPKLIVSLYTRKQEPYWGGENYGLVNRTTHYVEPSPSAIIKLESQFTHSDVCDKSEGWAFFQPEQIVKDFGERIFSDDIDDMFLQYDVVYPSSDGFMSKLQIHSAHIRTENAFITPLQSSGNLELSTRGILGFENTNLDMFIDAVSGMIQDSGFALYVSGEQPVLYSGQINLYAFGVIGSPNSSFDLFCDNTGLASGSLDLYASGAIPTPSSGSLELFTLGSTILDSSSNQQGGQGPKGVALSLFNPEILKGSGNQGLDLFVFAPLSSDLIVGSEGGGGSLDWSALRSGPFKLFAFNDHLGDGGISFASLTQSLLLSTVGQEELGSDFRAIHRPLFVSGKDQPSINSDMPLYLQTLDISGIENSGSLNLSLFNIHNIGGVSFNWDNIDYGLPIESKDNFLSSLSLDNEIRGVTTVGYGACDGDSPIKAIDPPLVTDDITWRNSVCVDGGIFRAFATYTNLDVQKAFDDQPGSYSGNYYDIRKYNKLTANESYFITMEIETGSTEGISQPRDWEEWEYGICGPSFGVDACCNEDCDQDINFSGIKLISDLSSGNLLDGNDRNVVANYGKSVSITEDLMAVGAPGLTVYDEYDYPVYSGGAVLLYRRNKNIAGKKAGWDLERKLTLPSGFIRDFVSLTPSAAIKYPSVGETEFSIPYQQWDIGQEGREFGHSVSLSSSGNKETVVVGAPNASWTRTFDDLNISGIPVCMAVFTDKFVNEEKLINKVANEARVFDVLYTYFAERWQRPEFNFNPRLDIKVLIYHFTSVNAERPPVHIKQDFIKHTYVHKLSNIDHPENDGSITVDSINNTVKSLFIDTFNVSNNPHSGLPPIMGVFMEASPSTQGGDDVAGPANDLIDFYNSYTYQSGVIDPEYGTPASGYINKASGVSEDWATTSIDLLNQTLATGNLIENDSLRFIASGFNQNANSALGTFQLSPPSGGKVYIFDKEGDDINLVQEIKTYSRRQSTIKDEDSDNAFDSEFGEKDYHDRFGHAVDISKDGNIIAVGSPFTPRPCEVFERVEDENQRMYSNIRDWFVHASGKHDYKGLDNTRLDLSVNISRYDELLAQSGESIAQKQSYLELNSSDKFFYRSDRSFWGSNAIELYKKIYDYKYTDIPYTGTWGFIASEFAPTSRLGYSCSVNNDGSIVAFGAPTDSFNEFDDLNAWYGGTTELESGNNRWASMTNAGAVRVFESRKHYTHSGVVEFTRFGNLDRSLNEGKDETGYDRLETYFGQDIKEETNSKPRSFRRMAFSEKSIPSGVGLAFITTPERDLISQTGGEEVLAGIKEWLSLGDRTLVIVANDPKFEDGGVYRKSTDIVNTILEKLGSRMIVQAARSQEEALLTCATSGQFNVIKSFQPDYNHTTFEDEYKSDISTDSIYALGVGDIRIRLKDSEVSVFRNDGIQMPCNSEDRILNFEPELPLKQLGDLRSQWNSICAKCGPNGCAEFEYSTNWPTYFNNPNPSQNCDQHPLVGNLSSPYEDPRPILTVAKRTEDEPWFIPASSYIIVDQEPIFDTIITEKDTTRTFLSDNHLDKLAFNIEERINDEITPPSGNYNAFNLKTFTNPSTFNFRNPILQAKGKIGDPIMFRNGNEEQLISSDSPLVCEEIPSYAGNGSKIIMIASTRPESALNLGNDPQNSAGVGDKNISFYSSIAKIDCENSGVVYQIGGWTGRESFDSVISDFDDSDGSRVEKTKSDLYNLLVSHKHQVKENFTQSEDYGYANVLWVADPTGYDNDGVDELKNFLSSDNKTVVITYNIQPTVYEYDEFSEILNVTSKPYDTIENITKICNRLELSMKPAFADLTGSYVPTSATHDLSNQTIDYNYEIVSGCKDGFGWLPSYPSEYTNIDYLTTFFGPPSNPARRIDFNFVPIVGLSNDKEIIKYQETLIVYKPKYTEKTYFTMNADSSVEFPVVSNSGYRVFVNYISETADDKITAGCVLSSNASEGGEFAFTDLNQTPLGSIQQKQFDVDVGDGATSLTVEFNSSSTELIEDADVFVEPRSVRIVSMSGCPLPKITETTTTRTERRVIVGFKKIETTVNIPARSGVILGEFIPFSSKRNQYLSPGLLDCDNVVTKTLIEDGPVIAAEELENFSSFTSGKRRSRIVVISDPTIIEGKCVHYRNNALGDNQKFIRSLYLPSPDEYKSKIDNPSEERLFDTGTKFQYVQKLRSPETGSPAKYYSKVNEYGLTKRFGEPALTPQTGNESLYRTDEDSFARSSVYRKKNPHWNQIEAEKVIFIGLIENTYGVYPRFSGVFQGLGPLTNAQKDEAGIPRFKLGPNGEIIEINQNYYPMDQKINGGITTLQKLTSRDYLDYIDTFSGYPGDLFGYSIDISDTKLIVGTPFNAYAPGKIWDWIEVSGDPYLSGIKASEYGGAGAAFSFERTGKGKNAESEFLPFELKGKIKPESANVGVSGGLSSANILAQKGIGTERHNDHTNEDFRQTDQFGRSVSVASDMFAIGAPNHDWSSDHLHIYSGSSAFLRKCFTAEFDIPRHEYPETSGDAVLNDGAVYTYRHDLTDFGDRQKEIVFAEKLNKQNYKGRFASAPADQFGTENDKFGISVDMCRSFRGDSDYTLVGGATNHDYPTSGAHKTGFLKNAGAAFTYDAMLREQPAVIPTEGGYISARVIGSDNNDTVKLTVSQPVSGESQVYKVSGVVFANGFGEIFLEGSGYDPATRGFVAQRPFVKQIYGKAINGTELNSNIDLMIKGEPGVGSGSMPLFIKDVNGGYVYNTVDLYTSGNIDYSSGIINMYTSGNRDLSSGIMDMFTSGGYVDSSTLNLRLRGK